MRAEGVVGVEAALVHLVQFYGVFWPVNTPEELFFIGSKAALNHGVFVGTAFVDAAMLPAQSCGGMAIEISFGIQDRCRFG